MKKYNIRKRAERQVNSDLLKVIIENKDVLNERFDIFVQSITNNESVLEADIVIEDFENKSCDAIILFLSEKMELNFTVGKIKDHEFLINIIELIESLKEARDDGFDNLFLYGEL